MRSPGQIEKSQLRHIILDYRRLLSTEEFNFRNTNLLTKVRERVKSAGPKTIHCFLPIERNMEPNMIALFPEFDMAGIKILIPKTDFEAKTMSHCRWFEGMELKPNKLGIPEPTEFEQANFEDVDLVFVPLVAADKHGGRLGYGGGYYDRLLKESKAKRVGLCLGPLLDRVSQLESWDISLDEVIVP